MELSSTIETQNSKSNETILLDIDCRVAAMLFFVPVHYAAIRNEQSTTFGGCGDSASIGQETISNGKLSRSFLGNDSGPVLLHRKFTACAYHVNNFAALFSAIAGGMKQFSLSSRQIKKFRLSVRFWNASCSSVNNFSHAKESIALI